MEVVQPFATTAQLTVYRQTIQPNGERLHVYTALDRYCEPPAVTVTAVVSSYDSGADYLWRIETAESYRRMGYATELLRLLCETHPGLRMDPATEAGQHLLRNWQQRCGDGLEPYAGNIITLEM